MEMNEEKVFLNLDDLLEIIGNSTRRIILSKLAKVPLGASELASSFGPKISRQAIHSQLQKLSELGIIENIADERNPKYRIKSNISLRINISPDYFSVKYKTSRVDDTLSALKIKETGCQIDYEKIESPDKKLRFLGEKIKNIEQNIKDLEVQRNALLHNKECFIVELKQIMANQYKQQLLESIKKRRPQRYVKETLNLSEEIFFTLFFNPGRYLRRFNIDSLLDDLFFKDMDRIERDQRSISIAPLLKDLSKFMGFLHEDEDDWFFDI